MRLVMEVFRPKHEGHVVADVWLQEHAAENRPLGIDVGRPFDRQKPEPGVAGPRLAAALGPAAALRAGAGPRPGSLSR
jgi:hypothetical protein